MIKEATKADTEGKEPSGLDETELFEKLTDWYQADDEHSAKWRKEARDDFDFYAGRQWKDEDRAFLEGQKRPVITFNRCIAIIKSVCGLEINSRHDTIYLPRESDTEEVRANEILTATSNWMADNCDAEDEQSEGFQNTVICGMGWTEALVEHETDPDGAYDENSIDPLEMRWDRNARSKNLADAKRLWRVRTMPVRDAMEMFPDINVDDLDASSWAAPDDAAAEGSTKTREQKRKREENSSQYDPRDEVTIVHAQWIEKEDYWRVDHPKFEGPAVMGQAPRLAGYETLDLSESEYAEYKKLSEERGLPPAEAVKLKRPVYKQAFLGNKILTGVQDGPAGNAFSWNCITGERDPNKGTWFGLIRVMRDPQEWANKFLSQTMHILNSTAKGGIIAEKKAFADIREAQRTYAKSDAITFAEENAIKEGRIMAKPGSGLAGPYVQLMEFAISAIRDVPGVNLELLGMRDANQPGILEHQRKQAGLTILATLFDSLRRFRKRVGRVRLYYIQEYFSDGRMIRIVGPDGRKFVRVTSDATFGKYDTEIDDAPTSPNQREQNWMIIQAVLPVIRDMLGPDEVVLLLEHSPLPAQITEALKTMVNDPEKKKAGQRRQQIEEKGEMTKIDAVQAQADRDKTSAVKNRAAAVLDLANAYAKGSEMKLNEARANETDRKATMDELLKQMTALAQDVINDTQSALPTPPLPPTAPIQQPQNMVTIDDLAAMADAQGLNGQGAQR